DEEAQLPLLDRQRPLEGPQTIRGGTGRLRNGLQLEADAGERLQHAVVQVARHAYAVFMHGQLTDALRQLKLAERAADFARDERKSRGETARGSHAGEVHAPRHLIAFKQGGGRSLIADAADDLDMRR